MCLFFQNSLNRLVTANLPYSHYPIINTACCISVLYSVKRMFDDLTSEFQTFAPLLLNIPISTHKQMDQVVRAYSRYTGQYIDYAEQAEQVTRVSKTAMGKTKGLEMKGDWTCLDLFSHFLICEQTYTVVLCQLLNGLLIRTVTNFVHPIQLSSLCYLITNW